MFVILYMFSLLFVQCLAEDFYYYPQNVTRSTLSGIAAYRSSLTLDWLAAEDSRQRELASAFETEMPPAKVISTDCIAYPRPAPGKIGRLMLELLKNLEGDDGSLIPELIKVLIRSKLLMENSILETEPDFDSLVKTPGLMIGEPHTTFPRIVEVMWMLVTDPATTRKFGWCPVSKVSKFLMFSKPVDIAKQMRSLDMVVSRARFIMEEFIQNVTPMNMYQKKTRQQPRKEATTRRHAMKPRAHEKGAFSHKHEFTQPRTSPVPEQYSEVIRKNQVLVSNDCSDVAWPTSTTDLNDLDTDFSREDRFNMQRPNNDEPCLRVRPTNRDIIKRFHAILPYFDKDHSNSAFLRKFRGTVYGMSDGEDLLDKEAAFYAAVLTPLIFLQNYRDTWCLLERFHRALRMYQVSHPTEKRSALKLLQNFRAVNHKIKSFVWDLPGPLSMSRPRTSEAPELDEGEIHDKKDIIYFKELIKNLG